ncbi:hypothetical protein [Streptomyces sp. NRRL S-920]|uniref:hypothetical protein n=1 Tax=Streptomyces sp. NRRL S-920 TaxID=1463921 RepID=UPI0004CBDF47|nr:hypothetical protein [Streptomyces sp. NRRL S-920]
MAAAALKQRPGQWGIVGTYKSIGSASGAGLRIKQGIAAAYRPAGAFEAVARTVHGEARLYARFVGEGRCDA